MTVETTTLVRYYEATVSQPGTGPGREAFAALDVDTLRRATRLVGIGQSSEEVAAALDMSVGAVDQLRFRVSALLGQKPRRAELVDFSESPFLRES
jgi:hypothetical protein